MTNTPTRPETMVERVARAMSDSLYGDTHTGGWDSMTGDVDLDENFKNRFRKMARAALEAMREPDFLMKMAGASAITVEIMEAKANYDGACDAWQAMIKAALGEGK